MVVMPFAVTLVDVRIVTVTSLVPAVAYRGSDIYAGPDSSPGPMIRLKADTPVCASASMAGYGFRRVQLADGKTGYVSESNLSN